jgi:hypothetical protein
MTRIDLSDTTSGPSPIGATLRAEGALIAIAATVAYFHLGGGLLLFALLILLPDVTMLGYLVNNRIGAVVYDIGHSHVGPILLGALAFAGGQEMTGLIALIWIAHIGLDRSVGYGLKYAAGFKETHLGRV